MYLERGWGTQYGEETSLRSILKLPLTPTSSFHSTAPVPPGWCWGWLHDQDLWWTSKEWCHAQPLQQRLQECGTPSPPSPGGAKNGGKGPRWVSSEEAESQVTPTDELEWSCQVLHPRMDLVAKCPAPAPGPQAGRGFSRNTNSESLNPTSLADFLRLREGNLATVRFH